MSKNNGFNSPQPRSVAEKAQVVSDAFGNDGGSAKKVVSKPRFHSMDIRMAENGVTVNHRMKKFRKTTKEAGASDHPTFDDMISTDHVFGNDHPVMNHINAIHKHIKSNMMGGGQDVEPDGDED